MLKKNLQLLIILLAGITATAQNEQERLINDMLLVAENFANPGAEGAAIQSSAGWFTSATTLEKWKFEVSVHGNALFVPDGKQRKLSSNRDFSLLSFRDANNAVLPTVYGGNTDAVFEGRIFGQDFSFDAIDGLNKENIIHPYPQVTMGLPYSTEVSVRFLPSIIVNDVGFQTYGIGLKHNFTQYYERRYNPEDFQFAAAIAYSNFKVDYAFEQISLPVLQLNRVDVNADLWLFQVLGSKLYDTFEVFGALGLTASNFDYKMGGTGEALPLLNNALQGVEGSGTNFKGDLGFNYYVGNFKISSMFTASNFFNVNLGIHYRI
ncbi:hypothetical protein FHG64_06790 [Antarcticibacterium flavum]|uniref:DUF4421 domain-containing protein n=2 Tax=Flavobacteriaceae TaxID=49546 RepID=A0A5B7X9I0_9FLAO|nr:hypothetical protein [Antarcticibacterium sp. W02-3]QCY71378.1 hypothetical protein FHG64_06790 [Antarcticibacterium flavum]